MDGVGYIALALFSVVTICAVFYLIYTAKNNPERTEMREKSNKTAPIKIYAEYYHNLIQNKTIKLCKNHRPITAALLYIISDIVASESGNWQARVKYASQIFSFLEKEMTGSEIETFDQAIDLFGKVAAGKISPRGDWCPDAKPEPTDSWFIKIFDCYGDVMRFPYYLNNYEGAICSFYSIDASLDFVVDFTYIIKDVSAYGDEIEEAMLAENKN